MLAGRSDGTITNSYSTGNVTAIYTYSGGLVAFNRGTIDKCYSSADVTGRNSGGLIGYDYSSSIQAGVTGPDFPIQVES